MFYGWKAVGTQNIFLTTDPSENDWDERLLVNYNLQARTGYLLG
jgi:hypothetical protein